MPLKPNPSIKLNIIYQDENILVIDKPAGLTVHPINLEQNNTLVNGLIAQFPKIKNIGDDPLRPGIVHRLDKDTSGLMLIARNNSSFDFLKNQFAKRKIIKKYLALVFGKVKDKKGTITKSISLSKKDYKKRSALLDEKSKKAWTEYQVLKYIKCGRLSLPHWYTLLEVSIKTGRTHQIRVHLASIGYPIVGDKQYQFKRQSPPKGLTRQFLHASYLKFHLLDGKMMELKSELPDELYESIRQIQAKTTEERPS